MKLRVLALALAILAFFLFVGSPFQQAANAVAIEASILAIIIAALAAIGIIITSTGTFNTAEAYTQHLLDEYAESMGTTSSALLTGVQTGTNKYGQILLNNSFVNLIQSFAAYLKLKFSLVDNDEIVTSPAGANINGANSYSLPVSVFFLYGTQTIEYRYVEYALDHDQYCFFYESGNSVALQVWSENPGAFTITELRGNGQSLLTTRTLEKQGNIYTASGAYSFEKSSLVNFNYVVQTSQFHSNFVNSQIFDIVIDGNSFGIKTGEIDLPWDNPEYDQGDGAVLDVSGGWGMTYDEVVDVIPNTFEDSEITYDTESEVQQQVEDTPAQSLSEDSSDYQVNGLASVFPFCIPFDLYNFVACLAADPVAPSFTWRFYVPGICDESIEIDLSEFDAAAQILRTMELLLFCVGLAFVTRKIIRG